MLSNVKNVASNTKFQIGFGFFIVLVTATWFLTGNQGDVTETTEAASTSSSSLDMVNHEQTPSEDNPEENTTEDVDAKEEVSTEDNSANQ